MFRLLFPVLSTLLSSLLIYSYPICLTPTHPGVLMARSLYFRELLAADSTYVGSVGVDVGVWVDVDVCVWVW